MTTDVAAVPAVEPSIEMTGMQVPTSPSKGARTGALRRLVRLAVAVLTAQYTLIAVGTGLSVAGTAKYIVAPHIIAKLEALTKALKR